MASPTPITLERVVQGLAAHLVEHARRDTIQAAVLLVTLRFGNKAGEWLLQELQL